MIRAYREEDKFQVIELLRQNTPEYFDVSEEKDLEHYLENEVEDYFVFTLNSKIVGAGGINYFPKEHLARISWDIVDPNVQGKGIGKQLLEYRLEHLKKNEGISVIVVRTTQLVYKYYEKMGFELDKMKKDFWAKNFDLYQLKKKNK